MYQTEPIPHPKGSDTSERRNTPKSGNSKVKYPETVVRLVAVGLKEAALDSPSFRASINYSNHSINSVTRSTNDIMDYLERYAEISSDVHRLHDDFNILFAPLVSDDVSNELVNKDLAGPCLSATMEGTNRAFEVTQKLLHINLEVLRKLRATIDHEVSKITGIRHQFFAIQQKYDTLQAKYMALPKAYNAAKTQEDAIQLFEIRKQYSQISLELWMAMQRFESRITTVLVQLCNCLWPSAPDINELSAEIGFGRMCSDIHRLFTYLPTYTFSCSQLFKDLKKARDSSQRGIALTFGPSHDKSDYDPSSINNDNVFDRDCRQYEKHGWVFLKSKILDTNEDVYIKRWLFVKDDVFGFLALSTNGCYVEESDKFGLLLANFNYYPNSNRKFCFEIKMFSTSLILEVESLSELRSWLSVLSASKRRALKEYSIYASARYPPLLDAFSLVPIVDKDLDLISIPDPKNKKRKLMNVQLSQAAIELTINPPMPTQLSSLSVLGRLYSSSSPIPSASTANFWGFINWGLYYVVDTTVKISLLEASKNASKKKLIVARYPENYPYSLRTVDAQLRAIFESFVASDELVLVHYKGSWSPNSSQELFCDVFMTQRAVYIYTNNCGLVSLSPMLLTNLLYFESYVRPHCEEIKAHLVNGFSMKLKMFIGSAAIKCAQANMVIKNQKLSEPLPVAELLQNLLKLEQEDTDKREDKDKEKQKHEEQATKPEQPTVEDIVTIKSKVISPGTDMIDSKGGVDFLWKKSYAIPSKALFHILFGDESSVLQCLIVLLHGESTIDEGVSHTVWRCNSKQVMRRIVWSSSLEQMSMLQTIYEMSHDNYYRAKQLSEVMNFYGIKRQIELEFAIYSLDSRTCSFVIYYRIIGKKSEELMRLAKVGIRQIMMVRVEELDKRINRAIGMASHGRHKVGSMIKMFGVITKYDSDTVSLEETKFAQMEHRVSLQMALISYGERLLFETGKMLRRLWKEILLGLEAFRHNMIWITLLTVSLVLNVILLGCTGVSYWREHGLQQYANEISRQPAMMQRAISLDEMNQILDPHTPLVSYNSTESQCYQAFLNSTSDADSTVTKNLIRMRLTRNDILSRINAVNNMESSYIYKSWYKWIVQEYKTCEETREMGYEDSVKPYCDSVKKEMDFLGKGLI